MACSNPVPVRIRLRDGSYKTVDTSCGRCLCCRMEKQSCLKFLADKELYAYYRNGQGASFVTLTYDDSHVPLVVHIGSYGYTVVHGYDSFLALKDRYKDMDVDIVSFNTLLRSDYQKFMKRFRILKSRSNIREIRDMPFKVISCGEYGDRFGRSHYHICFLGLTDSVCDALVRQSWPYGITKTGCLSAGGVRYVIKYCTKSCSDRDIKALRFSCRVENPFILHSIGLGRDWIMSNLSELARFPFFNVAGKLIPIPKYVRSFVRTLTGVDVNRQLVQCVSSSVVSAARQLGASVREYYEHSAFIREHQLAQSMISSGHVIDRSWITSHPRSYFQQSRDHALLLRDYRILASLDSDKKLRLVV